MVYLAHFGVALAEHRGPGGNTVSVVEIAAFRRIGTIDCGAYRRPHDVAFDGSGRLYILSEGQNTLLIAPDPLTGKITQRIATGGHGSHILSVTHDGGVVFSSNMESNSVSALFPNTPDRPPVVIPVGSHPETISQRKSTWAADDPNDGDGCHDPAGRHSYELRRFSIV